MKVKELIEALQALDANQRELHVYNAQISNYQIVMHKPIETIDEERGTYVQAGRPIIVLN